MLYIVALLSNLTYNLGPSSILCHDNPSEKEVHKEYLLWKHYTLNEYTSVPNECNVEL